MEGQIYSNVEVAAFGEHNALNAAAVFGLALRLGIGEKEIRHALKTFEGVKRRGEKRGEAHEILFMDDYAHHPTEIVATLKGMREAVEERRLVVVFQPHSYSRSRDHLKDFATAFDLADLVYVTDIYAAGEKKIETFTSENIVRAIQQHSTVPCRYLPRDRWIETLSSLLQPHDVCLTVGAGDITHLHEELMRAVSPKLSIGLVFGGLSCEHEISLHSARFVAESLNRDLYEVYYFGVDKEGRWVVGEEAQNLLEIASVVNSPNARSILDCSVTEALEKCDLFFPLIHGTYGEDGTLQGFFEMLSKPYIGPDWRSAAIGMDKVITKRLVASSGVRVPKDLSFGSYEWLEKKEALLNEIKTTFTFPFYVKPVHLGSSVGITKVEREEQVIRAIETAFQNDCLLMIEEGKVECRELEFAVMGNSQESQIRVPPPGEKLAGGDFVDYDQKYGANTVATTVYPQLPPSVLKKGQLLAKKAYLAVGCSGMARVDFLLDQEENFWFFEMNPIPGLQKRSLFPKIWQREGLTSSRLFDRLIILALQRARKHHRHFMVLSIENGTNQSDSF